MMKFAHEGTVFFDEIGELPGHLQAKILRLIQERSYTPVGGTKEVLVDVRIIAATNRNIAEDVKEGLFREDLYYRLNVVHIHLPPLKDRPDDIPLLAAHFLKKYQAELGRGEMEFEPEVLEALAEQSKKKEKQG